MIGKLVISVLCSECYALMTITDTQHKQELRRRCQRVLGQLYKLDECRDSYGP